jgi:hypothetical protein
MSKRWPHIRRFLHVEPSGWVEDSFHRWCGIEQTLGPAERAAGNEEWAEFFEFRLAQRADRLAADDHLWGLVVEWTESMTYVLRRCAAVARGEDPGPWVPQWERRLDLAAAKRARVDQIMAEVDAEREPVDVPVQDLRKVG